MADGLTVSLIGYLREEKNLISLGKSNTHLIKAITNLKSIQDSRIGFYNLNLQWLQTQNGSWTFLGRFYCPNHPIQRPGDVLERLRKVLY